MSALARACLLKGASLAACHHSAVRHVCQACACGCACARPPACRYDTLPPNDAHLQRIADHVSAYLQIVRSQLLATIPKAIVHCMVRASWGRLMHGARARGRAAHGALSAWARLLVA